MKTRIITGLIALALLLPILWIGSWPLVVGTCVLGVISISEFFMMKKKRFFSMTGLITSISTVLIILPDEYRSFFPEGVGIWELYFVFAMMLVVMTVLSNNDFTFDDAGVFMLASLYIGSGFHYFVETANYGFMTIMFVLLIIWATDTGAYLFGMRFGKRKLAPVISPNKSVEGSLGGIVLAVVVALVMNHFLGLLEVSPGMMILLATLMSVVGQLGDLTESAYKRYFGVKDSGKILPGHGGILDRFDSTLFVMPLFQIFLTIYQLN